MTKDRTCLGMSAGTAGREEENQGTSPPTTQGRDECRIAMEHGVAWHGSNGLFCTGIPIAQDTRRCQEMDRLSIRLLFHGYNIEPIILAVLPVFYPVSIMVENDRSGTCSNDATCSSILAIVGKMTSPWGG